MFKHKVTIIGAGPSGLVLARILQIRGVPVEVFEGENEVLQRDQGGTLDLHHNKGQLAMKAANLFDEFIKMSRPEGQETRILDSKANVLLYEEPNEEDLTKPEIDRYDLRNLLINSLDEGIIQWGKRVSSIEPIQGQISRHIVHFKDGSKTETDFLVGCDGAWSKVRAAFSEKHAKPNYSGVTFIETAVVNAKETAPDLARLVGEGSVFAFEDNKGLMLQLNSSNRIRVYAVFRVSEDGFLSDLDYNNPDQVRNILLEQFTEWNPILRKFLEVSQNTFIKRPLYAMPNQWEWQTVPGVAIIGDAAHVMTPFAGMGANLAMVDALDLANCLTNHEGMDLISAQKEFEKKLFSRATRCAKNTESSLNMCLTEGPPTKFVELMLSHHNTQGPHQQKN